MPVRTGTAIWEGTLKKGRGRMEFGGAAYKGNYSVASRFEQEPGTNPEELIAAAHAGCFSMALSGALEQDGYIAEHIHTVAKVRIDKVGPGFKITAIELETEGKVPGIDEKTFLRYAEAAKKNCPVSMALTGVDIKLNARLTLTKQLAA